MKTSLAWSIVAQMGFMILQCGLALFPLALLHIAGPFGSTRRMPSSAAGQGGRGVAAIRQAGAGGHSQRGCGGQGLLVAALAIYGLLGFGFGFDGKSPQAVALGAILIFAWPTCWRRGWPMPPPRRETRRTDAESVRGASVAYFRAAARGRKV